MSEALFHNRLIHLALRIRQECRKQSLWKEADAIRKGLTALGLDVIDEPDGHSWVFDNDRKRRASVGTKHGATK